MNITSQSLLQAARSFESLIGSKNVPFIISIWNEETERIEMVTNMDNQAMLDFINDMHSEAASPETYETHKKDSGLN